jgi:hypothetical protein
MDSIEQACRVMGSDIVSLPFGGVQSLKLQIQAASFMSSEKRAPKVSFFLYRLVAGCYMLWFSRRLGVRGVFAGDCICDGLREF